MATILQGTTPSVKIHISPDDLPLSQVSEIELCFKNGYKMLTYHMADLVVDTDANTVTKTFTVQETAKLRADMPLIVQGRFWLGGAVVGISRITLSVGDMLGVGADG